MEMIKSQTAPAVWLAAVEYLDDCPNNEDFDVFLHVAEPTVLSKLDVAAYTEVDSFLTEHHLMNIYMAVREASSTTSPRRSARFRKREATATGAATPIGSFAKRI